MALHVDADVGGGGVGFGGHLQFEPETVEALVEADGVTQLVVQALELVLLV